MYTNKFNFYFILNVSFIGSKILNGDKCVSLAYVLNVLCYFADVKS